MVVFIFGMSVFLYYFFIVPPEPVYYKYDYQNWKPIPRDAIKTEEGKYIIGYSRPSAVYVAPVAVMFYFFMILVTDGGRYRLREIVNFGEGFADLKKAYRNKIKEGKQEHRKWKNK